MWKVVLPVVSLCLLTSWLLPQERVKKKGPADFEATITSAKSHWEKARYAECIDDLQAAIGLATAKRVEALLAAFPAPAAGWVVQPDRNAENQNNPFAAMMQGSIGTMIERKYSQNDGSGTLACQLTADSPMAQMLGMAFGNPALVEAGSEAITYGPHKGLLKTERNQLKLQVLIHGKHLLEVTARNVTEDQLFAIWNQEAIDALAAVLGA